MTIQILMRSSESFNMWRAHSTFETSLSLNSRFICMGWSFWSTFDSIFHSTDPDEQGSVGPCLFAVDPVYWIPSCDSKLFPGSNRLPSKRWKLGIVSVSSNNNVLTVGTILSSRSQPVSNCKHITHLNPSPSPQPVFQFILSFETMTVICNAHPHCESRQTSASFSNLHLSRNR